MRVRKALVGLAVTAAITAATAAGGVQLPTAQMLSLAIEHCKAPSHLAQTLKSIGTYYNETTKCSFPGYELLAAGAKRARRTVIERVRGIEELNLEQHGICVVTEFRNFRGADRPNWPFASERRSGDVARSNNYRIFVAPWLAEKVGCRLHGVDDGDDWRAEYTDNDDARADEAPRADGFAAPDVPLPSVLPPPPPLIPSGAGKSLVGAVTGEEANPPSPPQPAYPETEEVKQIREAMLQHPETADLAPMAGKYWHHAQHPDPDKRGKPRAPRALPQAIAAIHQTATKTLPTMTKWRRWGIGISFLFTIDPEQPPTQPTQPRLSREERRILDEQEDLDKQRRRRLDAETARKLGMTPDVGGARQGREAVQRAAAAALAQKSKDDLARLAAWEAEQPEKKPP